MKVLSAKAAIRVQLYHRDGPSCHYCGIAENDFITTWGDFYGGKKRGRKLEVDRKNNDLGYELDNCVLACAICNNAKSDKFKYEEFKLVGEVIRHIWQHHKP